MPKFNTNEEIKQNMLDTLGIELTDLDVEIMKAMAEYAEEHPHNSEMPEEELQNVLFEKGIVDDLGVPITKIS